MPQPSLILNIAELRRSKSLTQEDVVVITLLNGHHSKIRRTQFHEEMDTIPK